MINFGRHDAFREHRLLTFGAGLLFAQWRHSQRNTCPLNADSRGPSNVSNAQITGHSGTAGDRLGRVARTSRCPGRTRTARPASIKTPSRDSERQSPGPDRRRRAGSRPCGGGLDNTGNIQDTRASTRLELQLARLRRCHRQRSTRLHRPGRHRPDCAIMLGSSSGEGPRHRSSSLRRYVQTPSGKVPRLHDERGCIHDPSGRPARWAGACSRNSLAPRPQHAACVDKATPPEIMSCGNRFSACAPRRRTPSVMMSISRPQVTISTKAVGMPKAPITNITFGTMTLGYRRYGARVHDAATC